jgi:hypothetical protein
MDLNADTIYVMCTSILRPVFLCSVGIPAESVLFRPSICPLVPMNQLDIKRLTNICGAVPIFIEIEQQ